MRKLACYLGAAGILALAFCLLLAILLASFFFALGFMMTGSGLAIVVLLAAILVNVVAIRSVNRWLLPWAGVLLDRAREQIRP